MTNYDKEMGFMEYFNFCRASNIIHFLIAHSLMKKSCVITTNFDYLIEWALHDSLNETTRSRIQLVITKEDFEKIENAQEKIDQLQLHFPTSPFTSMAQNVANKQQRPFIFMG